MDSQPLVGREEELAQLEAVFHAIDEGASAALTIEGEPGIGKTRLMAELRSLAEGRGYVVLSGAAAEFEREMPFSVWVDALDAYVVSQDLEEHEAWSSELAAELGQVLPSLSGAGDGTPTVADERYRSHRAVRRLLALLAEDQPLVLALDDLHWSDDASLELVSALVRRELSAPVLLAMGFRTGQASERLASTLAAPGIRRLHLRELSESQALGLLGHVDAESAQAIFRHGGGNPLYLEQLSRSPASGTLPASLAGAIAGELEGLSERSRGFLNGAAVAGEPFEPDLAAAIAGLSEDDGYAALDDLLAVDLVRPTDVPRRFGFRHPLVRQAVYDSVGGGWRLAAHARAAEALAARGASAAARAHHVEQSAGQGDELAIETLLSAGRDARSRAPAAAARWFEAALRLLPADDTGRRVSVRVALAGALRSLGELDRCRETLLETIELLPPEDGERRIELITLCAAVEHWQGRHEEAHRRLMRAWEEMADREAPGAGALLVELAVDGLYENDFSQALEMGRCALETSRSQDDRSLIAAAASALALAEVASGAVDAAREHREEALSHIEFMDDGELSARLETLYYLGWAENFLELYEEAIAHASRGVEIARATGEGRLLVPLILLQGFPLCMRGRLAEARATCESAVEIARVSANPHYQFWALYELGWAEYFAGRLEAAEAACSESSRVGQRLQGGTMPSAGGGPGWLLAILKYEAGREDEAIDMMREVAGPGMENWFPVERCFNWENLVLAEIARGRLEDAEAYARRGEEQAAALESLRIPTHLASRARAYLLLAQGDAEGAALAAERSAEAAAAAGADLVAAFSRSVQGTALASVDRDRAVRILKQAEQELDTYGSERMRNEARRELRKLGARVEVRGPASSADAGVDSLSKRELEIAELITDRLTNPQIAEKLFLSKKTVESHVRNLFVKLGVSSRVEVARTVESSRRERDPVP